MRSRRVRGHAFAITFWTVVALLWLVASGCRSVGVDPLWGPVSIVAGSTTAAALGGPVGLVAGAAIGAGITLAGMWATTPEALPPGPSPQPFIPTWVWILAALPVMLFAVKLLLGPRYRELIVQALGRLRRLDLKGSLSAIWSAGGARHSRPAPSSSSARHSLPSESGS